MTNPADKFKAKRTPSRGTPRAGTMGYGAKKKKKRTVAKGYMQTKGKRSTDAGVMEARYARNPGMGKPIKRGDVNFDKWLKGLEWDARAKETKFGKLKKKWKRGPDSGRRHPDH